MTTLSWAGGLASLVVAQLKPQQGRRRTNAGTSGTNSIAHHRRGLTIALPTDGLKYHYTCMIFNLCVKLQLQTA